MSISRNSGVSDTICLFLLYFRSRDERVGRRSDRSFISRHATNKSWIKHTQKKKTKQTSDSTNDYACWRQSWQMWLFCFFC